MGDTPAIIVVDMTYGFVDSAVPLGHSETGYPAVAAIRRLLAEARPLGMPIFYSRSKSGTTTCERGRWKGGGAIANPRDAGSEGEHDRARGQTSHKVALFEIHMKYGDVLPLHQVIAELHATCAGRGLPSAPAAV
jgi:nicotinamidase-related amidase